MRGLFFLKVEEKLRLGVRTAVPGSRVQVSTCTCLSTSLLQLWQDRMPGVKVPEQEAGSCKRRARRHPHARTCGSPNSSAALGEPLCGSASDRDPYVH